jgi:hypothetical protein
MVAVCDKVKFSIPEQTITIGRRGGDAWLFTTWGLIEWVFENASQDGLLDFIHLKRQTLRGLNLYQREANLPS